MKKIIIIISLSIFLFSSLVVNATANFKTNESSKNSFNELLEKSLDKLHQIKDINDLHPMINEFKRLGNIFPDEWLTDYYVAYLDLKLVFVSKGIQQTNLLKEAKDKIDRMRQNKKANLSEVITLEGYYYYALIAQNPKENGRKYYKEVILAYNKAIVLNKQNPRPLLLLSIFKNRMSKFMGGNQASFCQELKEAEKLFKTFKPQHLLNPTWGEKELRIAQSENCLDYKDNQDTTE